MYAKGSSGKQMLPSGGGPTGIPQDIAVRIAPFVAPYMEQVGLNFADITMVQERLPTAGEFTTGTVITIDPDRLREPSQLLGLVGHEIMHMVQERLLGSRGLDVLRAAEMMSWGPGRNYSVMGWGNPGLGIPDLATIPLSQLNPVSGMYALEAIAFRVQVDIQWAYRGLR